MFGLFPIRAFEGNAPSALFNPTARRPERSGVNPGKLSRMDPLDPNGSRTAGPTRRRCCPAWDTTPDLHGGVAQRLGLALIAFSRRNIMFRLANVPSSRPLTIFGPRTPWIGTAASVFMVCSTAIRRGSQAVSEHGREIAHRGRTPNLPTAGDQMRRREHLMASLFAFSAACSKSLGRIGLVG